MRHSATAGAPFRSRWLFRSAWSQIDDGLLPLEVCLGQLPAQLRYGQRIWSLRYLPFHGAQTEQELEGVLVVIADVTQRLAHEREEAEHGELMQCFKRLIEDRKGFSNFLQEASAMIQQVTSPYAQADLIGLKGCLKPMRSLGAGSVWTRSANAWTPWRGAWR